MLVYFFLRFKIELSFRPAYFFRTRAAVTIPSPFPPFAVSSRFSVSGGHVTPAFLASKSSTRPIDMM